MVDKDTGLRGDNDPLDVIEIGMQAAPLPGTVKTVKVLGALAMLDDGETDWKIVAVDAADPLAPKLHDIEDVERECPGLLDETRKWFRVYKVPDGKPENSFAFDGRALPRSEALRIIAETHAAWKSLYGNAELASKFGISLHGVDESFVALESASGVDSLTIQTINAAAPRDIHYLL